ncbi:uncharacterized protein LOC124887811 [Capsicum annuum]|uniref:uncharacterized protein LOC124887811 n=1 Tax=Capsicum annuum TaxID=4072 RepID=UPI001FB050D7|nr:uncharacterized protein LOC124887811 [Capsicum annuum]
MDVIAGLSRSQNQFDSIWVIVNRMTKFAYFLPVQTNFSVEDYARLYLYEIVKLYGMNGQAQRTIKILDDMLQAYVIDYGGSWAEHLSLIEFAYNNSYHSSIRMALFKSLYGRRYRSPIGLFELGEMDMFGLDLVYQAVEKVKVKLSPRFVGPYTVLQRVGNMAYELVLPPSLNLIHPIFYVSMMMKCVGDPSPVVSLEGSGI